MSPRSFRRAVALLLLVPSLVLSALVVTSPAHAQKIRSDFWGMHDNEWATPPTVPVGSANLTTSGTYWPNVEAVAGVYNWTRLDQQVTAAEAIGAQPMIVLGQSPRHASTCGTADHYRTCMPDVDSWKAYVAEVAKRYGTRLDYQIWPEPNITQNWTGTPRQMATLTVLAAKVIDAAVRAEYGSTAARRVRVVSPAVALRMRSQRQWTLQYFRQKVGGKRVHAYVDAIAVDPFPDQRGTPEDAYALMQSIKKQLARIGVRRKPYWNNEINYGVRGGGQSTGTRLSVAAQQSYVIRTYALSAAARMQRTYWLGWFSTDTMSVNMTDSLGVPQGPSKSYEAVRKWLNGTNFRGCSKQRNGVWVCTARRGEVRRIYWRPRGRATVTLPRSAKRIENQSGGVSRKTPRRVRVTFRPIMVASRR